MKGVLKASILLILTFVIGMLAFGATAMTADGAGHAACTHNAATAPDEEFPEISPPGDKVPLDADHYFIYGFTNTPKLGPAIMKVEIFTRAGQRDTSFVVKGSLDMPSMRGAHSSGDKEFSLSKRGSYLMPSNIVMPGDWEVRFTFEKNGETILQGAYRFDI